MCSDKDMDLPMCVALEGRDPAALDLLHLDYSEVMIGRYTAGGYDNYW